MPVNARRVQLRDVALLVEYALADEKGGQCEFALRHGQAAAALRLERRGLIEFHPTSFTHCRITTAGVAMAHTLAQLIEDAKQAL